MEDKFSLENLTPEDRMKAIAGLLADGFLRIQPTRIGRLRSAVNSAANSSELSHYGLDREGDKSVYATVNHTGM